MRRPSFVIFITDPQRADHLGCYGNPMVQTPHIDGLAAAGVRFTRFHVVTPICQPNRAALVTGQMPSVNGVRQNGIPLGLDSLTFAEVLRGEGYRTGYIGKAHFQNVTDIPAPPRTPGGEVSGRLGSAIDFAPTLLQRAGLKVPIGMQGQDLFAEVPAPDVLVEDPGIQVFRDSEARKSTISLVTERWRLSLFEGEVGGELYDLVSDPLELTNRWEDPACREKRLDLQARLGQRLRDRSLVATARA